MGTGKTTIGKLLAEIMNRSFTDIDGFIENRYHQTITGIFEEKGEAAFREIERRALLEISVFENTIVSTGGGLPCFFDNMEIMNRTGITVYLKATVEELILRLTFNKQDRPLIKGKNSEELREFVEKSLKNREPFYNQAAVIIDVPHCYTKIEIRRWIETVMMNYGKI